MGPTYLTVLVLLNFKWHLHENFIFCASNATVDDDHDMICIGQKWWEIGSAQFQDLENANLACHEFLLALKGEKDWGTLFCTVSFSKTGCPNKSLVRWRLWNFMTNLAWIPCIRGKRMWTNFFLSWKSWFPNLIFFIMMRNMDTKLIAMGKKHKKSHNSLYRLFAVSLSQKPILNIKEQFWESIKDNKMAVKMSVFFSVHIFKIWFQLITSNVLHSVWK